MPNKDNLLAYPVTNEIEYRSKINSRNLNEMIRSIEESVLRSIIRSSELEAQMTSLNLGITSAYTALGRQNQMTNSYPEPYNIPSGFYGGVAFATAFGETVNGRTNSSAGILTLDWEDNKKTSKVPIYNDTLSANVEIYVDDVLRPQSDAVYNILDNNPDTFWVETAVSGVHTIEIRLPPSVKQTFNYIEANPFPVFGMEITNIEYYDLQSSAVSIYDKTTSFYNSSGPIVLHLAPKKYNNTIKFTLNVIDGINTMGFSKIDISSIDYVNNTTTTYIKFENLPTDLDHNDGVIDYVSVDSVTLDFYIDGVVDNNYDQFISSISIVTNPDEESGAITLKRRPGSQNVGLTSILVDQGTGVASDMSDNTLYLKVIMNEVNQTTPVFRGAKIDYREVL